MSNNWTPNELAKVNDMSSKIDTILIGSQKWMGMLAMGNIIACQHQFKSAKDLDDFLTDFVIITKQRFHEIRTPKPGQVQ